MKKNYHLLALIAIAFAFSACNPLDKTCIRILKWPGAA